MEAATACAEASIAHARECLSRLTEHGPTSNEVDAILAILDDVRIISESIAGLIPHGDIDKMVAVLDRDWTAVESVYANQVAVKDGLCMKSKAAVSAALKNGTKCQGRRLKMWVDLDEALQADFLSRGHLPKQSQGKGTPVYRLDPVSGEVVGEFPSFSAASSAARIAAETLKRACENGQEYGGSCWSKVRPDSDVRGKVLSDGSAELIE